MLAEEIATGAEVAAGELSQEKLARLTAAFARDGVCVLANVRRELIPHSPFSSFSAFCQPCQMLLTSDGRSSRTKSSTRLHCCSTEMQR